MYIFVFLFIFVFLILENMKKIIYLLVVFLLLFFFCKLKKNLVFLIFCLVLNVDFVCLDSFDVVVWLFLLDIFEFKKFLVKWKREKMYVVFFVIMCFVFFIVVWGICIISFVVSVFFVYLGIDWVKKYEFIYCDVFDVFDGFCIVFILDLYYKSFFKEKGLESLVCLLNV